MAIDGLPVASNDLEADRVLGLPIALYVLLIVSRITSMVIARLEMRRIAVVLMNFAV
jgi:hypothetical protein